MKVVLFGASGMVGKGALLECLDSPAVDRVLVVGRSSCGVTHTKLDEVLHRDFGDYSAIGDRLSGFDACFFCLGVSSVGMSEADYRHVSYDFTIAAAEALLARNSALTFIYVSGTGTDSTEKGGIMWARVKGATENKLLSMPFKAAYMFRPGIIQAKRGVAPKGTGARLLYAVLGPPLIPLLKLVAPNSITTTERVGRAMIRAVTQGYEKKHLENADINALGS
jgi:uncharacterized protein YbjT (DUF2867 family)